MFAFYCIISCYFMCVLLFVIVYISFIKKQNMSKFAERYWCLNLPLNLTDLKANVYIEITL